MVVAADAAVGDVRRLDEVDDAGVVQPVHVRVVQLVELSPDALLLVRVQFRRRMEPAFLTLSALPGSFNFSTRPLLILVNVEPRSLDEILVVLGPKFRKGNGDFTDHENGKDIIVLV